ncbi:MAG TPA: hypothetical protein VF695_06610 [Sphingomonas sp.]|jgi:hypothetical protein
MPLDVDVMELSAGAGQCAQSVDYMIGSNTSGWRIRAARDAGFDPRRCLKLATHLLDGRNLCAVHAGAALLAQALRATTTSEDVSAAMACASAVCRNMDGPVDIAAMARHFAKYRRVGAPESSAA